MIRIELTPGQLRAVLSIARWYVNDAEADESCLIYQAERKLDSALLAHEVLEDRETIEREEMTS